MALDAGTTSNRCILFNESGEMCSVSQREFPQYFPKPGWVEHDANEIWATQLGVAVEAMQKIGATAADIAAIGITNQRETAIVWDKVTGEPIHHAIVWQCRRTSEISGSTRKIGRQKGGGGARRGDMNSPVLVGGGRVFGPKPRDYYFKLNKKVKALARKSALSYKAQNNAVVVVEDFSFEAPKTKDFVAMTKNLKVSDKKLLVILPEANKNVYLSARNVKGANVQTISGLNTYRVLDAGVVVFAESALSAIDNILM